MTVRLQTFGSIRAKLPVAGAGQRIGLMGGSFNPPHAGHRLIVETARKRLGLNHVWWLVTPGNPLKAHSDLASSRDRMRATEELAHHPRSRVTDLEKDLASPFTAATVQYLVRRRPDVHFVWIMGADSLRDFTRWRAWETIFATLPIVVVDRPGLHFKSLAQRPALRFAAHRVPEFAAALVPNMAPPAWTFLTGPQSPQSSTALRRAKARKA